MSLKLPWIWVLSSVLLSEAVDQLCNGVWVPWEINDRNLADPNWEEGRLRG